jgi:Raf kinase inhibitor-like YbhB/YbcL family protein
MLEKLPHVIGQRLKGTGPGLDQTMYFHSGLSTIPETITVTSPVLTDGQAIPRRFTEDGEKLSPPLGWTGVPPTAQSVVLVIEDADSPTPAPIVHALVFDLPGQDGGIAAGDLRSAGSNGSAHILGKNTFLQKCYLPPDPPPGGGAHRYVFQVYALDRPTGLVEGAGRGALKAALEGHVVARGCIIATYERP